MTITFITSFNDHGYGKYGKSFIESFLVNWPQETNLHIYHETPIPIVNDKRVTYVQLFQRCPNLVNFLTRNATRFENITGKNSKIKLNARKFSFKTFSIIDAVKTSNTDYVIWLDGDIKTFSPIPHLEFFESLCPKDCMVSYLGRENKHSECGFVIYNCNHPNIQTFVSDWESLYIKDTLFNLDEWHDSFVFDALRKQYEIEKNVKNYDISKVYHISNMDHPFINSPLGQYMDHLKGSIRKQISSSLGEDIIVKHDNPYWNYITETPRLYNRYSVKTGNPIKNKQNGNKNL